MSLPIQIDDQPIASTFFKEGRWLTDFVTPDALEVRILHKKLTEGIDDLEQRLFASWDWVADRVRYVKFVKAKLWVNGKSSVQTDYWSEPTLTIQTKVGNCVVKSLLLASLIRNDLPAEQVSVVLGNLNQPPGPGGHAWCQVKLEQEYIMESTRGDMQPMIASQAVDKYEAVVFFNDQTVSAIEDRTLLTPFAAVYANWLKDYLDWSFIEGVK